MHFRKSTSMRRLLSLALAAAVAAAALSSCTSSNESGAATTAGATSSPAAANTKATGITPTASTTSDGSTHDDSADYSWDESTVVAIELKGTTATSARSSVKVSGSTVTITEAGSYRLSGTLSDGQVVVDTDDKDTVRREHGP